MRETAFNDWKDRFLRAEVLLALAAFAVLCAAVLMVPPQLVEPDDYAYRASVVALADGYPLTLSSAEARALAAQVADVGPGAVQVGPDQTAVGLSQWVRLPDGRWISQKDPGYPFLATPFQVLGLIRLAPLSYGALGCLGLFFGARRWLGRCGGAAAVGLFCSSGAALLFAWRDYMPTFTDASLIAAGTGALLWAVLAGEAAARRRTWTGLLGFLAIEAAAFTRYTDMVVLGCAVLAVLAVRWRRPASLPPGAVGWWLGSAVLFGAGLAVFNDQVYAGPLSSGYPPGLITFSLSAVGPNLRDMPAHLLQVMPMTLLGLLSLAWIAVRWAAAHRRVSPDLAVGLALAASWFSVWALYAAYTWTTSPDMSSLSTVRFYLPAIGPISLLGAWLVTRLPLRAPLAAVTTAAVVVAMFGLGTWSYTSMRDCPSTAACTAPQAGAPQPDGRLAGSSRLFSCRARNTDHRPVTWISLAVASPMTLVEPFLHRNWTLGLFVATQIGFAAGTVIYNVTQVSFRQRLCPAPLLGRMNATMRFLVWGTMPLGGLLGSTIGIRTTLLVAAIGQSLAFLWVFFSPLRSLREVTARPDQGTAVAARLAGRPVRVSGLGGRFGKLSRGRTRCPRCPASRGRTRCRHRRPAAARGPRRARPAGRIRPPAWPGAQPPRARCRPARQDAPGS